MTRYTMDPSCSELEFFDFSNASEEEIKEVQEILRLSSSNGFVELPWEIPLVEECRAATPVTEPDRPEVGVSPESQKSLGSVVGQALLYALPHASVASAPIVPPQPIAAPLQNPDLLPVDEYLPHTGIQLPAGATTISHYPNGPYVFSARTYPYMRAYPHLGVPLFTCALPGSNEMRDLNPMQTPYGQFVSLAAAAVPQMDKHTEMKEADMRAKNRGPSDRQFNRRNKKKHLPNNSYGNPEMGSATDSYQESVVTDDQISQPLHQGPVDIGDNLPSVTSSVPLVPLPVPPSTFAVTSGAIPMHGYPPGLPTLPYSQISGHQTSSPPVYYVPVFNHHPYASYIPSPTSGPMIVPMGVSNIHPVSDSSSIMEEQTTGGNDAVASETTGVSETSLLEHSAKPAKSSPDVVSNTKVVDTAKPSAEVECTSSSTDAEEESVKNTSESTENSNTLHEAMSKVTIKDNCIQGRSKADEPRDAYPDGSRCWADLFKKQCSEVNGLDRQSCASDSESSNGHTVSKDISNGKLYSVPGSEDIL